MDRKEVAKQLREEAAQLVKAAEMLDGSATGKRRGRPPGAKAAKKPGRKAGAKRVGRPPGRKPRKAAKKPAEAE